MMPILLVGDSEDLATVYIGWLARQKRVDAIHLNERSLGIDWTINFDDKLIPAGYVEVQQTRLGFEQISGAFVRLNPHPSLPPGLQLPAIEEQVFLIERRVALHQLLQYLPGVVVNRPSSGRSNGSKPYQMRLLVNAGFAVPRWIATNDLSAVDEFTRKCWDKFIYKSCSGLRSQVRRVDPELLYRLYEGTTPVVVQEYIPGKDVRVHTVKSTVFPTEVSCPGVDYRFETEGTTYQPTSVPDSIAALCCQVAEQENLIIAGFDFRVTEDQRWYCLEVNPVPNFLPYEMSTGQPIGEAVVDILAAQ